MRIVTWPLITAVAVSVVACSARSPVSTELAPVVHRDQRWLAIDSNSTSTVSIDTTRLTRLPDQLVDAWLRTDYREVQRLQGSGARYVYAVAEESIDCTNQRFMIRSIIDYRANGEVVGSFDVAEMARWTTAAPETRGEQYIFHICAFLTNRGR